MPRVAVMLPKLGTGATWPIVVSYWYASRGEEVLEGDRLVELLVGPATFDVPAPVSGRLVQRCRAADSRVAPGDVLGWIAVEDAPAPGS